jgi:hypothetical protein
MIGASFDSTRTPLQELLARADTGKLQLPDFQRAWVWDDDRIRGLLASASNADFLCHGRSRRLFHLFNLAGPPVPPPL